MAKDLVKFAPLLDLTGLFDRHPLPKTPWLIIVDGLDEISNRDARTDLLHTVAAAAATHPSLYRFTVLTRPLPELDTLGPGTPATSCSPSRQQTCTTTLGAASTTGLTFPSKAKSTPPPSSPSWTAHDSTSSPERP